jgi:hypothetical protein
MNIFFNFVKILNKEYMFKVCLLIDSWEFKQMSHSTL